MALLKQQEAIICKRGEGGKATAEARNEQSADGWSDGLCTLGHTKEDTYYKATENIHNEGPQRKSSYD